MEPVILLPPYGSGDVMRRALTSEQICEFRWGQLPKFKEGTHRDRRFIELTVISLASKSLTLLLVSVLLTNVILGTPGSSRTSRANPSDLYQSSHASTQMPTALGSHDVERVVQRRLNP